MNDPAEGGALLTDDVRAFIGREVTYTAPEEIGRAAFRYFALAIGDDNRLYADEAYARANGYPTVIAPPTLVCETNQIVPEPEMDGQGYIGHAWDLPVSGCRLIRGGNAYTFERPVVPSDRVTVTWRIASIEEKTSSDGRRMLVVTSEATYVNQHDERLARNVETLIYQRR